MTTNDHIPASSPPKKSQSVVNDSDGERFIMIDQDGLLLIQVLFAGCNPSFSFMTGVGKK